MNLSLRLFVALSVAVGLWGCSSDKACEDGTILLAVDVTHVNPRPDSLSVSVAVAGGPPVSSDLSFPDNVAKPTIAIEFPSGYPAGSKVDVQVVLRAAAQPVAISSGSVLAPQGCGTLDLIATSSVDAGINDGGSLPIDDAGPTANCVVGAKSCRANIVVTCGQDGALVESEECMGVCQNGSCVGECTPGSAQCIADGLRTCSVTGSWSAAVACPAGCADSACLPACAAGTTRCNANQVQTCTNGAWANGAACENVCRDGACGGECKPTGPGRCAGKVLQNCSADGKWVAQATCEFVCAASGCAGECVPDTKHCNGAAVEVCNSMGAWQNVTTCENACSNGVCTPKIPGKPGVAPTAVVTPATGTKVREKNTIVITFSEEMDIASVKLAFNFTSVGTGVVSQPDFIWTPDKTVLTIDPKFVYPTGAAEDVVRASFSFTIGTGAKDANGEALKAAVSASYPFLYRRITPPLVGYAQAGNLIAGSPSVYSFLQAALRADNVHNDGFVTFSLPALGTGYVIEKVSFLSETESTAGTAEDAGNLRIAGTSFALPMKAAAFTAPYTTVGEALPAAGLWTVGTKMQFTVTSAVAANYKAGSDVAQFRLYLDGPGISNVLRLHRQTTFLEIVYLIP